MLGARRQRRRDERRRGGKWNAEGEGNGEGVSPPQPTRGSGERRDLPQQGPGGATAENEFDAFCGR